jgi:hypothetical protein
MKEALNQARAIETHLNQEEAKEVIDQVEAKKIKMKTTILRKRLEVDNSDLRDPMVKEEATLPDLKDQMDLKTEPCKDQTKVTTATIPDHQDKISQLDGIKMTAKLTKHQKEKESLAEQEKKAKIKPPAETLRDLRLPRNLRPADLKSRKRHLRELRSG